MPLSARLDRSAAPLLNVHVSLVAEIKEQKEGILKLSREAWTVRDPVQALPSSEAGRDVLFVEFCGRGSGRQE